MLVIDLPKGIFTLNWTLNIMNQNVVVNIMFAELYIFFSIVFCEVCVISLSVNQEAGQQQKTVADNRQSSKRNTRLDRFTANHKKSHQVNIYKLIIKYRLSI